MTWLHSFDPGGVERVALRMAGLWASEGHEVVIAIGRQTGAAARPAGVTFDYALPNPSAHHYETLWLIPHLIASIRRRRPDVLFCAGNTYVLQAVLARLVLGRACPPIVAKVSNSLVRNDFGWLMRILYPIWLRIQARFIDRFVAMAQSMRPELAAALGLAVPEVAMVHDGALSLAEIDAAEAAAPLAAAAAGRVFMGIGRLAFQKDFGLLITAFARIAGPDDRLVILGEGPERGRLEQIAAQHGVRARVQMPGHVAAVIPHLSGADVFVLSSRYEGVPAAVLEALAAAVPIVATDCSVAMSEILEAGRLGALVAPGDAAGLAAAMAAARPADAQLRAAMRSKAREFTVERAARGYLGVMDALVRRSPIRPAPSPAQVAAVADANLTRL